MTQIIQHSSVKDTYNFFTELETLSHFLNLTYDTESESYSLHFKIDDVLESF